MRNRPRPPLVPRYPARMTYLPPVLREAVRLGARALADTAARPRPAPMQTAIYLWSAALCPEPELAARRLSDYAATVDGCAAWASAPDVDPDDGAAADVARAVATMIDAWYHVYGGQGWRYQLVCAGTAAARLQLAPIGERTPLVEELEAAVTRARAMLRQ